MTDREEPAPLDTLARNVRASWQRVPDVFEPVRPELYRYCRHLTGNPWDAEDLVQDAMARAFAALGTVFRDVPHPRAWLFRVASNLWIDRTRSRALGLRRAAADEPAESPDPRALREAAGTLLTRLSPQERVALVLKDAFAFSLDEIAAALVTSAGAVKAALHRARGKLAADETATAPARLPAPGVLDAFRAAFNARDVARLSALLLDTASVEIVGVVTEHGPDAPTDPESGSFAGMLAPITNDHRGGVAPALLDGYLGDVARCEVLVHQGRPILLFWYGHAEGPAVRALATVETEGDRVARLRNYFFSPDVLADVCNQLGLPHRPNGYRYW